NHLWDRHEALGYIQSEPRIVKPMNYPSPAPGNLFHTIGLKGYSLRLFCLTGQMFMPPCDSPFTAFDRYWEEYKTDEVPVILDFHAESTAEKRAMGWHVDGKISAILGTHTHIQTADEEVLEQGTAYITDVGMTGAHDSVIGIKKNLILEKMRTGVPVRYEVSNRGLQINGVLLNIDEISRKALSIERIRTLVGD
ncbi:MAG: TIGR00282 family metallophosphoesterase, partial [Candidatus Cloacimonetes bacterium]|nr:TIGR00282 family metallophosphoesterase [Candidatus Cloacimonadota bacterium]